MNNLKTLAAVALLASAFATVPAQAAEREDGVGYDAFVKMCDTDKDGMLSKAEVMKHVEKMFDKADTKKMGMLDKKQVEFFLKEFMRPSGS